MYFVVLHWVVGCFIERVRKRYKFLIIYVREYIKGIVLSEDNLMYL